MGTSKNYYENKENERSFLGEITKEMDTDENLKNSAIETGKDLLVGAVGGGIVGAMLGKFSLFAGAGVTFLSHYYKKHVGQLGRAFGIAMMSSGSFEAIPKQTVSGTEDKEQGVIEGITERIMGFKDDFSKRLFLDKVIAKKEVTEQTTVKKADTTKKVTAPATPITPITTATPETEETEKPVGEVRYLLYPGATKGKEAELSDLDHFEDGIHESATEFRKNNSTEGLGEEEEEMGETDELDPTERNY